MPGYSVPLCRITRCSSSVSWLYSLGIVLFIGVSGTTDLSAFGAVLSAFVTLESVMLESVLLEPGAIEIVLGESALLSLPLALFSAQPEIENNISPDIKSVKRHMPTTPCSFVSVQTPPQDYRRILHLSRTQFFLEIFSNLEFDEHCFGQGRRRNEQVGLCIALPMLGGPRYDTSMFGLLNVHKPAGVTSRDVVNRIQRLVRPVKVGHAGTLDPLATGVLVICLGPATRLIEYVQREPKQYRGTFLFGRKSDTEDVEGHVDVLDSAPQPTSDELCSTLSQFLGTVLQRPPAYSALKVDGKRAYQLARDGHDVRLAARPVEIHSLSLHRYNYPEVVLDIRCGSGTYVRSLGRDIAEKLNSCAVMSALERTAIGNFTLDQAMSVQDVTEQRLRKHLMEPIHAVANLEQLELDAHEVEGLHYGRKLTDRFDRPVDTEAVGVDSLGRLIAILVKGADGMLRPKRNFAGK